MLTQKEINNLFSRKVPMRVIEDLIDEAVEIAYNRATPTILRNKQGNPILDEFEQPIKEDLRPHSATNQLAAIRFVSEYAVGKPGQVEPDDSANTNKGGVVVILPSNSR